jgi:hypothetical protein
LPRFRVRSVLFELPSSPDATMSDEKGGCPFGLRLSIKIFSRMSIHTIVYLQEGAVHNGGTSRRAARRYRFFQRHRKPGVLARECHHQVILLQKGRLRTRCRGASSQLEPGCDAEGGLLTSTTSLVAGDGGWPLRMALMRSSCVRQSNVWDRSRPRPAHCPCRSWVINGIAALELRFPPVLTDIP